MLCYKVTFTGVNFCLSNYDGRNKTGMDRQDRPTSCGYLSEADPRL